MLALPALLFAIGAFLIVVADHALVSSLQRMAHARFQDHANEARRAMAATVAQAEPLLAELAARLGPDGQASVPGKAAMLRALAAGRDDVAWISWSTPDGHFVGLQQLPGDVWGVTDQMPQAPGRTLTRRYGCAADGSLVLREEDPDDTYDPRQRPFWLQAVASAGPVWTRPYAFHEGGVAGVTCALAVRSADGALLGVATVDFSFASLSTLVARLRDQHGGTTLVFTRDREVLAWPGDLPAAAFDRLTRFDDLDPIVARFASQVLEREPDAVAVAFARDDGGELLGAVARLPVGGQEWLIGSYVAMDEITAPAAGFRSRSAAIAAGGVV
ncbi:MAG: cache domain-containing protein, partial [Planctomycetes bacterium]|nr:cache domain-containing protein [Planctomycetota bacterium]